MNHVHKQYSNHAFISSYIETDLAHSHTISSQTQTLIPIIPFLNHLFLTKKVYYRNEGLGFSNLAHFYTILLLCDSRALKYDLKLNTYIFF